MITGQVGGRHRRTLVVAAGALTALGAISGCGATTTPVASVTTPTDPRVSQPLPGASATSLTLGFVPYQVRDVSLVYHNFSGLDETQIAALARPLEGVGGRTVSVTTTPLTVNGAQTPPQAQVCAQQRTSSIVITDDADPRLIDCLIANGSIVVDASGQPWDTQALVERAPYLWATATAEADAGEKVLLAQAQAAGVLKARTATVVSGPDPVTTRVAQSVTVPGLQSAGATTTNLTVGTAPGGSVNVATLLTQSKSIAAGSTGVLRPLTPQMYAITASTAQQASGPTHYLITSTSDPAFVVGQPNLVDASVPPRTSLLGWAPVFDGTQATGTAQANADPTAAAACSASLGTPPAAYGQWSAVYRFCDAVALAKIALAAPGTPTPASFRDTVWSNGTQWQPAAVSANGWQQATYTGANLAQWFTWNSTCKPTATDQPTGCFAPGGPTFPLTS